MTDVVIESASPEDTCRYGKKLAVHLKPGDVVCLSGNLGQGKTLLAKAIAAVFKVEEPVTSPTFSLLNIYTGNYEGNSLSIYHFDLYRLEHDYQIEDLGFDEFVSAGGIAIIEWPDNFLSCLPGEYLWVKITPGDDPDRRRISLTPHGERYERLCRELTL